jgi:hypothetical protein
MNGAASSPEPRRIALIGPEFFSYVQAIRDEFIARGYPCRFYDERHSNSIFAKGAYRLQWSFLQKTRRDRHLAEIRRQIETDGTTDVFLINPEVVTVEFVQALRSSCIRVHMYMWDSVRNKKSFPELLPLMAGRSSFEPEDCARYGMTYLPLFAERVFSATQAGGLMREDALVFLGTMHSNRAKLLFLLEQATRGSGLRIHKLLYYYSRSLYVLKCLWYPGALRYLPSIRTQNFDKNEIASAYFRARAVLDLHHPCQAGLTSRTFEALRSGAWLVTVNPTVRSLPFELQERVVLLTDIHELSACVGAVRRELPPLSQAMDHFLSLERFAETLLSVGGLPPRQARKEP